MLKRVGVGVGLGASVLLLAPASLALPGTTTPCFNDTDCPGLECGGMVCDWTRQAPNGDPERPYLCVPAGSGPKGAEGWCTSTNGDDNCKCRDVGARCVGVYCTFTRPQDAPSSGGSIGFAGSAPVAGAKSVAGGSSVGGAPSRAGSGPASEPVDEMGHEDTEPARRTSQACSVSIVGRDAAERNLAALAGLAALLAVYCRKRARIPR